MDIRLHGSNTKLISTATWGIPSDRCGICPRSSLYPTRPSSTGRPAVSRLTTKYAFQVHFIDVFILRLLIAFGTGFADRALWGYACIYSVGRGGNDILNTHLSVRNQDQSKDQTHAD